jgi:tRNA modification GTPase
MDPVAELLVDQVLVSIFRAPQSYTGQDVIEISCHGGLAVTKKILGLLLGKGVRHAEPGEFTRRAFLNGKLDLTQAEAVLDLIHAKSDRSLDIAIRQLSGSLSRTLKELKNELVRLLAHMEAYLDFPEEDLGVDVKAGMQKQFKKIQEKIRSLLVGFERNQLIREGILVTIVGKPNVGKSSLFNALLERDRALVSDLPHTTRDHLEEALEIRGFYIRLRDTAGLISAAEHPLDKMSMDRTLEALRESHLVLYVVDGSAPFEETDRHVFRHIPVDKRMIVLINKSDLPSRVQEKQIKPLTGDKSIIRLSAKTREGFKELEEHIAGFLEQETSETGEQITRLRHKKALELSLAALERAETLFLGKMSLEFVTPDLRAALEAMKELTGEVYSEDLLNVIFSEFCIGK